MRNVRGFVVCFLVPAVACLSLAWGQEAPKPGPEHERLGFWIGTWNTEADIKENPIMPAGRASGKDRCEWFEGGFAVVCHNEGSGPMGPMKGLGIMGYSPEEKAYTYYGVDSSGMAMTTVPRGKVDGKTWVYDDESVMEGQTIKSRYTIVETSKDSYSFKWEMQGPEGNWMTILEGKGSRS